MPLLDNVFNMNVNTVTDIQINLENLTFWPMVGPKV